MTFTPELFGLLSVLVIVTAIALFGIFYKESTHTGTLN